MGVDQMDRLHLHPTVEMYSRRGRQTKKTELGVIVGFLRNVSVKMTVRNNVTTVSRVGRQ